MAADLNGDGVLDLVVVCSDASVRILRGLGGGQFANGNNVVVSFPTLARVAFGDFNGDGRIDIALSVITLKNVRIFLGDGQGGLSSSTTDVFANGFESTIDAATGDFDGDGKLDLAVAASNAGLARNISR